MGKIRIRDKHPGSGTLLESKKAEPGLRKDVTNPEATS
jgi:hypothetical protein